jgi:hypothetical protein
VLTVLQRGIDGISIASGVTLAAHSLTQMRIFYCSAMARSSAIIAPTVVVRVETKSKIWQFLLATKHFVQHASDAEIASARLKTFDTRELPRVYSV